ncbi:MAG: hypothetical protein WC683_07240 [bacterium]
MNTRQRMAELQAQLHKVQLADRDNIASTVDDILVRLHAQALEHRAARADAYARLRSELGKWEAARQQVEARLAELTAKVAELQRIVKPTLWQRTKSLFGR